MIPTLLVSGLAAIGLLGPMQCDELGQAQNPIFATQQFVQGAIEEFNQDVVEPLGNAVAALQGEVDGLEGRVQTLEADQGGGGGTGTVRGRLLGATVILDPLLCQTLKAVAGRLVTIQGTSLSATTGLDGRFAIEGVPAGRYFELNASGNVPDRSGRLINNVLVPAAGGELDLGDTLFRLILLPPSSFPTVRPTLTGMACPTTRTTVWVSLTPARRTATAMDWATLATRTATACPTT